MNESEVRARALELVEQSQIAMVGGLGEDGDPQIKAMIKAEHEGLETIWFSTNTSSDHVAQFRKDPRACVYFAQWAADPWCGLTLGGRMEILRDRASLERLWDDGSEKFYPKGVEDPDYTVLRFVPEWGKYWQFGTKVRFDIAGGRVST